MDVKTAPVPVVSLAELWDGMTASVAATVTTVDRRATGYGSPWAVVTLEDDSGSVKCAVFPATYRVVAESLTVGARLVVRGRVDAREAEVRLIAMTVTKAEMAAAERWRCPGCDTWNTAKRDPKRCHVCGEKRN
ncbi:MAG TPA: OB-fold nucleic acid binding domain-containing protein [Kofleriaceae bacterium]|nr:OB-fold nucleic acid binding domain-containing protein [Kofleriaceae bacterium]